MGGSPGVLEPKKGFEPLTPALRKRCSTIELLRRWPPSGWGWAAEGGKISVNRVNSTSCGHARFGGWFGVNLRWITELKCGLLRAGGRRMGRLVAHMP